MKIDDIIKDLSSYIIKTKDIIFLGEFMYIASLTDDELDDAFYHYLKAFINCYFFYFFNPGIDLADNDKFIFRRFFLISLYRLKRGLVFIPDTKLDDLDWSDENEIN